MSFQTVLSLVGVAFTAFELHQRFRPKSSSGSAQSPISPREEPKQSEAPTSVAPTSEAAGAEQRSKLGESQAGAKLRATTRETPRSAVSSKIEMA